MESRETGEEMETVLLMRQMEQWEMVSERTSVSELGAEGHVDWYISSCSRRERTETKVW